MTIKEYLTICYNLGFINGVIDGSNVSKEVKDSVFLLIQNIQCAIEKYVERREE